VLLASPGQTRRAVEGVLETLSEYSQWVEAERHAAQSATVYTDIGKLTPYDGQQIARQIIQRLAEKGFQASIGLASNKFVASVVAKRMQTGSTQLVRKGEEAAYLVGCPVTYLPLDAETARRLDLLGLRQMGQLAGLPRAALIEQFGTLGKRIHLLSCGEDTRRVAKYIPPITQTATCQFDAAVEDRFVVESVFASLSAELMLQLADQQMACREVLLTLHLDDHTELEASGVSREPLSTSSSLYRFVQQVSERLRPHCGIIEVGLRLNQIAPLVPRQLSLFDQPQVEALHTIMLGLSERYGVDCFYQVEVHAHAARLPEFHFHLEPVAAA